MTASAVQEPDRAKIKRNVARMEAQGANDDEIERYIQSEGLRPVAADAEFEAYRKHETADGDFAAYRAKHGETRPSAPDSANAARIQRNLARLKAANAPRADVEAYLRSEGAVPQQAADDDFAAYRAKHQAPPDDTSGFRGAGSGGPLPTTVPLGEGLVRALGQGLTLGFLDEAAAGVRAPFAALASGKSVGDEYRGERDRIRERQRGFEHQAPTAATLAEALGGIAPAVAAGPAGLLKGGMAFGGASALGHGEGDAASQAKAAAGGAVAGGLTAGAARLGGKAVGAGLDKINPARVARRSMATVLPDDAVKTFALRQALAPKANVPGDLSAETATRAKTLGKSAKTAITGRRDAWARVKEIGTQRKTVGKKYNDLGLKYPTLPADPIIVKLADDARMPLANPGQTSFAEIHRLRHEVQKQASRAKGMSKHDLATLKDDIDFWLKGHVPEVAQVDARFAPLSQHLTDALNAHKAVKQGAGLAADREMGAGTRQGNRLFGIPSLIHRAIEPSPARKAEALQKVAFTPENALGSGSRLNLTPSGQMAKILRDQRNILRGPTPFIGRDAAAQAGAAVAPQLSHDAPSARAHAAQLRAAGMTDSQVEQQLAPLYAPELVRFIVAATPQRVAQ